VADDVEALFFVNVAGDELAVCLEGRDNVEAFLLLVAAAWRDGAAIYHQGGPVEAAHSHDYTGHIFVAAGD